jgi:hypothetical protein
MVHQLPIFAKDTGSNPMLAALARLPMEKIRAHTSVLCVLLLFGSRAFAQSAPVSSDHPWHGVGEQRIEADGKNFRESRFSTDPAKNYSLAELIDLAETRNPETQLAWERTRVQAAALSVARSELFPTLAAAALSQTSRQETYLGTRYYRQTFQDFQGLSATCTAHSGLIYAANRLGVGRPWILGSSGRWQTHFVCSCPYCNKKRIRSAES